MFFGKNTGSKGDGKGPPKEPPEGGAAAPDGNVPDPNEGPGKGKAFFDRAKTVAATGNFDYAIDMYIEGLNKEPFNVEAHKALREVALRRKLGGGKPAGGMMGPKLPYKGKTPKEALLNHEFILSKDYGNIPAMLAIIRNALIMTESNPDMKDVVLWIGPTLREANRTGKSPKIEIFQELAEIYANRKIQEYAQAADALQAAIELKPTDMELIAKMKDYAAQETLKKGNYEKGESFKGSIKDQEMTKKLLEEENLGKSMEYLVLNLAAAKAEYEKNPKELQVIAKYSKALADMGDEEHENEAMALLKRAFDETKIYRLKMGLGDIRIHQLKRNIRMLKEALAADPADKGLAAQLEQARKERLAFELGEFKDRADNLPTDMHIKFELGVRLYESGMLDDAIVALQEAQQNARHRVDAMHLLGRAFLTQGMKPEAVDTLKRSIAEYDMAVTGDPKSKNLHYWYARALEANGNFADAIEMYSKIIRWDIGFLDSRKRLNELREKQGGG